MSLLGIYFGQKAINIAETKGRKLLNKSQILQSTLSGGELEEKVPAEVKLIEIIALFKEELRKNKIKAKDVTLALSGKDLIIRTFEIPFLPKEELQSAINFEAKKYIPFKVEDLISDFQLKQDKESRTNLVIFMGIKKEALESYVSLFSQLDIKIKYVEYSAFSLLRCLKLSGSSDKGIIGILGADIAEQDETNFLVAEDGLPVFSRDISLGAGPDGFSRMPEEGPSSILEKLKTELRVSLDYYQRKYPGKSIKKIYLFCSQEYRSELEGFIAESGLAVKFVDAAKCVDRSMPFSLSFIKAYSASVSRSIKSELKINLLSAGEKTRALKEKVSPLMAFSLFRGIKFDPRILALALLICLATYGLCFQRILVLRKGLQQTVSVRKQVKGINSASTYEELGKILVNLNKKKDTLDTFVKKQIYLTELLDLIPRSIPKGAWLTNFTFGKTFDKKGECKVDVVIQGLVLLSEPGKEFEAANNFMINLKENKEFSRVFKEINIASLDRRMHDKVPLTGFEIDCKTYSR